MGNTIIKKLADAQSLAASFNSSVIPAGPFIGNIGINIETSGVTDNEGIFYVDHRIVSSQDSRIFSAWADVGISSNPTLSNTDLTTMISLSQVPVGELRIRFEVAGVSPDGTVTIWFSGRTF